MNKTDFGRFYTEVFDPALWLVTSAHEGNRGGLIATFVSNASLAPDEPRVIVGIAKHHFTWKLIERSRALCLHLVDLTRIEWVRRFGLSSGHDGDKFAGLTPATGSNGAPVFAGAVFWAECNVEAAFDTGDRSLFLGRVTDCGRGDDGPPVTMSEWLASLNERERQENEKRWARDVAIDAAAIREWRAR
jgi:flavin reductase (DIM6/NTAB) family NADH-FMN oxidoreductase RutF